MGEEESDSSSRKLLYELKYNHRLEELYNPISEEGLELYLDKDYEGIVNSLKLLDVDDRLQLEIEKMLRSLKLEVGKKYETD